VHGSRGIPARKEVELERCCGGADVREDDALTGSPEMARRSRLGLVFGDTLMALASPATQATTSRLVLFREGIAK
jgi:hypothetical protein